MPTSSISFSFVQCVHTSRVYVKHTYRSLSLSIGVRYVSYLGEDLYLSKLIYFGARPPAVDAWRLFESPTHLVFTQPAFALQQWSHNINTWIYLTTIPGQCETIERLKDLKTIENFELEYDIPEFSVNDLQDIPDFLDKYR